MGILFIFLIAFIFASSLSGGNKPSLPIVKEKRCPPHKWAWVDQKDAQGVVHSQRMICAHCGPLSKLVGPGND
jgi:hypothetical protein